MRFKRQPRQTFLEGARGIQIVVEHTYKLTEYGSDVGKSSDKWNLVSCGIPNTWKSILSLITIQNFEPRSLEVICTQNNFSFFNRNSDIFYSFPIYVYLCSFFFHFLVFAVFCISFSFFNTFSKCISIKWLSTLDIAFQIILIEWSIKIN